MKFFVVILAVIGIQSIGNTAGQENEIFVTVNSIRDLGSGTKLRAYHSYGKDEATFLKDVKQGDLLYFMDLSVNDEVLMEAKADKPYDFCEDSVQADIVRGALLPEGQTSCPVSKGEYEVRTPYDALVSDPQKLTQMKCGQYTGLVDIGEDTENVYIEMEFEFMLDEDQHKCKN